jgi:hypothetical protein
VRSLGPCEFSAGPCQPGVPSQELQTEPVIVDPQISVRVARDGIRRDGLDLLGHDPDISCVVAPLVPETVDAEAVTQPSQGNDVFLEPDIGTMASTTMATAPAMATASAMTTATMPATPVTTAPTATDMAPADVTAADVTTANVTTANVTTAAPIATPVPTPPTPPIASAPTNARAPSITAPIPPRPVPAIVIPTVITPQIDKLNVLHRVNSVDRRADCSGRAHLCRLGVTTHNQSAANQRCCGQRDNMSAHHFSPVVALQDLAAPTRVVR